MALAKELGLDNVHFHDSVPKSKVPAILAAADAGLMTLFRSPLIHIYFENKFIDYMGSRLPILAAMDGIQADLIGRDGAGQVVPAFDHEGLAGNCRRGGSSGAMPENGRGRPSGSSGPNSGSERFWTAMRRRSKPWRRRSAADGVDPFHLSNL